MATIQGVYVALFGRPADPTGLAYFNTVTNNGADLTAIGDLAATQEYKDLFAGLNNTQIVNSIYQRLFNRDAETSGLNFFVDKLNKGELTINNIAIAILDGALGSDKTTSDAKVAAADLFTGALDTPAEIGSYVGNAAAASARGWLSGITTAAQATQASADAAVAAVVSSGAAGNTITAAAAIGTLDLTTGIGAAGDVKTTTNLNDTINAGAFWAPATSKIDGGLGTDTLNATINGLNLAAGTVVADGLKNVEVLNVTTDTAASLLTVGNAKELTTLTHVGGAANANLEVDGLSLNATLGLKGTFTNAATTEVTFADANLTSTAKVALDAVASAGVITVNDVGTVDVSNTGASTAAFAGAAIKTINVSGSGSLSLTAPAATIETVAAGSFAGNLTADFAVAGFLKSVVSGSGADSITVYGAVSANNVTVDAGAGNDTIKVASSAAATKTVTITTGEGSDIVELGSAAVLANVTVTDNAALLNSLVIITDFNAAQDAIKVNSTVATWDKLLDAELADVADEANLLAAATKAASYTTVDQVTVFNYGGNAYILVQDGDLDFDGGEGLIQVTGASVADFTATNFQVF